MEQGVKRMGVEVREIIPGELDEGIDHGLPPSLEGARETVGLPFEAPAKSVHRRREEKRKHTGEKAGDHRFCGEGSNADGEQGVEQMTRQRLVGAEKEDQRNEPGQQEPLEEMVSLPVAYLVRQHREDLIGLHGFEERIEEDDPFRPAYAGKIGVRVPAPLRLVHLEHLAHIDARPRRKGNDGSFERLVLHRGELVEQGLDHIRCDIGDEDGERKKKAPHPEPPETGARLYQPKPAEGHRREKQEGKQGPFQEIEEPDAVRHGVEAVLLLYVENGVEGEGQGEKLPGQIKQDKK